MITVDRISSYISHFIREPHEGNVHSVYRNTINIMSDGQLIAVQSRDSILSPISLITSLETVKTPLKTGDVCEINETGIFADSCRIIITPDTEIFDTELRLQPPDKERVMKLVAKSENMIMSAKVNGFADIFRDKKLKDLILITAKKIIESAEIAESNEETARILSSLIGLGTGLTPSGDDFLCGVLAGLKFLFPFGNEADTTLKRLISSRLNDTNDISRAFLLCALKGEMSSAVHDFFGERECLEDFLLIGHSSGIDTLCGIFFALRKFAKHLC